MQKHQHCQNMGVENNRKKAYKVYSVEDEAKVKQAVEWWKEEQNSTDCKKNIFGVASTRGKYNYADAHFPESIDNVWGSA